MGGSVPPIFKEINMLKNIFKTLIICIMLFASVNLFGSEAKKDTVLVGRLEFVINTATVIENEQYEHFANEMLPLIEENKENVMKVMVVGSASPEGNKARNRVLETIRSERATFLLSRVIDRDKIEIINSSEMFLHVSKREDSDFAARRGVYIEVWLHRPEIYERVDTIRIEKRDTLYSHSIDTIYIEKPWKRIPILAVKTNLASDIVATPNVQAELYTWLWGLSLEFDYTCPWWHKDYGSYVYYQLLDGKAGIRKYLNNKYNGHWIGVYANTAIYDFCFWNKDKGWQGEVYGAGLGYGYVFQSKKYPRIKFEPYIRVGWFNTKFDTYHASQPWNEKYYYNWYLRASDFVPRRFNMNYFGPTEIGFNFTFDLICLRKY